MISVFDLVAYIVEYCRKVDTVKLYKYIYWCHVWYMVWNNGKPLIKEPFEAWINGPMIKELYDKTWAKQYLEYFGDYEIDQVIKVQLDKILDLCIAKGDLWLLSKATYDASWRAARQGIASFEASRNIIDNEAIYVYYKDKDINKFFEEN